MTRRRIAARPFIPVDGHIETGLDRRVRAALDVALKDRSQVVLMGLPREGKSASLEEWLRQHPVCRVDGVNRTDVLFGEAQPNGQHTSLLYQFGAPLSTAMPLKATPYELGLIRWSINAGVVLIVVDEAQRMPKATRTWLWGFVGRLLHPPDRRLEGIEVGLVYLAAGLPRGKPDSPLFDHTVTADGRGIDLDYLQFTGRLDTEGIRWLDGLDEAETGEALVGFANLYRPQFPDLHLKEYTVDLFKALLDPRIDYAEVGRARMDSIKKVVVHALRQEAGAGGLGAGIGDHLAAAAVLLQTRPIDLEEHNLRPIFVRTSDSEKVA
jgi:hypothetical protein